MESGNGVLRIELRASHLLGQHPSHTSGLDSALQVSVMSTVDI